LGAGALGLGVAAASVARRSAFPLASVAELRRLRAVGPALLLSLAAWLPASASVTLAAAALGHDVPLRDGMRVFATSTLVGGITLMPAGLGTTGSAAVLALEPLGLAAAAALPVVALFRLTTTGFALAVGAIFLVLEIAGLRRRAPVVVQHFDEIAQHYQGQYSEHMWRLLLERKVGLLASPLPPPARAGLGLDMGCGLGHQCVAMRERGYRVVGLDASQQLLQGARASGAVVALGDARSLPFPDGTFDFVYAVGMLHHLPDADAQAAACREAARVLKPGGSFLVHETNTRNPLFRFYMGYVFPILKTIDEGTERWIEPARWTSLDGLELVKVRYFTFLPDTIPRALLGPMLALERRLEAGPLAGYAVHYMAHLRKPAAAPPAAAELATTRAAR
ncbi:MAG TPA: methyltransferase domain-containing protein, partial [Planctomycetota bacterium]|nr:methyltransferase domain-containing protein [Planctomycetota bacterium]